MAVHDAEGRLLSQRFFVELRAADRNDELHAEVAEQCAEIVAVDIGRAVNGDAVLPSDRGDAAVAAEEPSLEFVANQLAEFVGEVVGAIDLEEGRKWWAFQPVREIAPPKEKIGGRLQTLPQTKIDSFLLAKLNDHGLSLSPPADSRT